MRNRMGLGILLGILLLAGAGMVFKKQLEAQVFTRLQARLPEDFDAEGIDLGPGRFDFQGFRTSALGGAVSLRAATVSGSYSMTRALRNPRRAVNDVTLEHATIEVDLDVVFGMLTALNPDSGSTADARTQPLSRLEFPSHVVLRDAHIALVRGGRTLLAGRIDGTLVTSGDDTGVRILLDSTRVDEERVCVQPFLLPRIVADGRLIRNASEGRIAVRDGQLTVGGWSATGTIDLERNPDRTIVALTMHIPETAAAEVQESIPPEVLGAWRQLRIDGTLAADLDFRLDTANPLRTRVDMSVDDRMRIRTSPDGVTAGQFRGPFRHGVRDRSGQPITITTGPGSPRWVPLDRIDSTLVQAVLAHEDAAFYRHRGFAPWAIEDAVGRNLERGRFAFGASTISMQLAKNLFLSPRKTLARKLREVWATYWLENQLSKDEILALYMNVIEYGPGIYGIGEASRFYFDKTPADLEPAECVYLATVLPSPRRFHRQYERGELSAYSREQMEFLLNHMHSKERIDRITLENGLRQVASFRFGGMRSDLPVPERGQMHDVGQVPGISAPIPAAPGTGSQEPRP